MEIKINNKIFSIDVKEIWTINDEEHIITGINQIYRDGESSTTIELTPLPEYAKSHMVNAKPKDIVKFLDKLRKEAKKCQK